MKAKNLWPILALAIAAALGALLFAHDASSQTGPTISMESGEILEGGTEVTRLSANVTSPELCGFTVDIVYDPSVKDATDCEADPADNFAVAGCNVDYTDDTVRVAGAAASGVTGHVPLVDVTWIAVGSAGDSTVLSVQVVDFLDCSIPPQPIPGVTSQDGVNVIVAPFPTPTPTPGPPAVGGIVEMQVGDAASTAHSAAAPRDGSVLHYFLALGGAAAAATTAAVWYARRRWLR